MMTLCNFSWGDWSCSLPKHDENIKHKLVWVNNEDDIDPRLT